MAKWPDETTTAHTLRLVREEAVAAYRAELRAKVEGLPTDNHGWWSPGLTILRAAVLALLDEQP
jgi:hypothetical protein